MSSDNSRPPARASHRFVKAGIATGIVLFLIYSLQSFTPLRINPDAVDLLNLASKLTDHQPYLLNGTKSLFPIGTPLLFSLMERIGIASSAGFVSVNVLCILIAAGASLSIYRSIAVSSTMTAIVLVLAFSSFILVKHVTIPLTDIPFMAASLSAVACLQRADRSPLKARIIWFIAGVALSIAAISFRRIGIALVPACLFVWRRDINVLATAVVIIAAGIVLFSMRSVLLYMPDFPAPLTGRSAGQMIGWLIYIRCLDLGEVLLNVPYAKLHHLHPIVIAAGVLMIIFLATALWRARKKFRPVHVYLLAYLAVMFAWPYGDNRFWLPVLPLLSLLVAQAIEQWTASAIVRPIVIAYAAIYLLMFTVAAAYSTRVTFSKRFPEVYAGGQSRADYLQAWSARPVTTEGARIIRRYGMR